MAAFRGRLAGLAHIAGLSGVAVPQFTWGRGVGESRGSNGIYKIAPWPLIRAGWTLPPTNGRERT